MPDSESKEVPGERREHFRGRSRPGRRVDVSYRRIDGRATAAGAPTVNAVAANIGVGGAFVLSEAPEAVGSKLELQLRVPDRQETLVLEAEVRWTKETSARESGGMGLKFAALDVAGLLALREYFASLGN